MARKKLQRFAYIVQSEHATEYQVDAPYTRLHELIDRYDRLVLELGCGYGEYTVALAEREPGTLCVGVDVQGERIYQGIQSMLELGLANVHFVRAYVEQLLEILPPHCADEIWLTFPDPQPKERWEKKRLVAPRFLEMHSQLLKEKGILHLKTDSDLLYEYALETVPQHGFELVYNVPNIDNMNEEEEHLREVLATTTRFETIHREQGDTIHYTQFTLQ